MFAFATSTSSGFFTTRARIAPSRSRCTRISTRTRTRTPRMDVGLGTIFADALVLGAVVAGATYVLRDKLNTTDDSSGGAITSTSESGNSSTSGSTGGIASGVLGLMGESRSAPQSGTFKGAAPRLKDKAVALQEELPNAELRRAEEVAWATNALCDLGPVTMAVFDAAGGLVGASGELLRLEDGGTARVNASLTATTGDVSVRDDAKAFKFLDATTRSVATFPLKVFGGVLVVASDETDFFGPLELRVAQAVATRLASFMPLVLEESTGR